jgi:hypothetical protein
LLPAHDGPARPGAFSCVAQHLLRSRLGREHSHGVTGDPAGAATTGKGEPNQNNGWGKVQVSRECRENHTAEPPNPRSLVSIEGGCTCLELRQGSGHVQNGCLINTASWLLCTAVRANTTPAALAQPYHILTNSTIAKKPMADSRGTLGTPIEKSQSCDCPSLMAAYERQPARSASSTGRLPRHIATPGHQMWETRRNGARLPAGPH